GLDSDRTTVLVTGGSLGAARLNAIVPALAEELVAAGGQVLHLTGRGKLENTHSRLAKLPEESRRHYHLREYLPAMAEALAAADVVVSRAGAGMVSELAALGLPAIYVPLPVGNGEQRLNARPVVSAGGGLLVEDRDLTPTLLREQLLPLVQDEAARSAMGRAAARAGITDGAARLADLALAAAEAGR